MKSSTVNMPHVETTDIIMTVDAPVCNTHMGKHDLFHKRGKLNNTNSISQHRDACTYMTVHWMQQELVEKKEHYQKGKDT